MKAVATDRPGDDVMRVAGVLALTHRHRTLSIRELAAHSSLDGRAVSVRAHTEGAATVTRGGTRRSQISRQ